MRKLLLVLATILVSSPTVAVEKSPHEITDSFTDKIKALKEDEQEIVVHFARHNSAYKMLKTNPRFLEFKTKLEKLKKEEKKVKILARLPMMEIREITE